MKMPGDDFDPFDPARRGAAGDDEPSRADDDAGTQANDDARAAVSSPADSSPVDGPSADDSPATDSHRPRPRLQILHIMLWTALAAVLLGVQSSYRQASHEAALEHWFYRAVSSLGGLLASAQIAGMVLVLWYRGRRAIEPLQPGHWLLIANAATTIVAYAIGSLFIALSPGVELDLGNNQRLVLFVLAAFYSPIIGLGVALNAAAAVRCRQRAWQWQFVAAAIDRIAFMLPLFLMFVWDLLASLISGAISLAYAILFLVVAIGDLVRRRKERDWLHWLGVATVLASFLLEVLQRAVPEIVGS